MKVGLGAKEAQAHAAEAQAIYLGHNMFAADTNTDTDADVDREHESCVSGRDDSVQAGVLCSVSPSCVMGKCISSLACRGPPIGVTTTAVASSCGYRGTTKAAASLFSSLQPPLLLLLCPNSSSSPAPTVSSTEHDM